MSEEEKAIEYIKEFKNEVFEGVGNKSIMAKTIDILLNLLDKQQKEIEEKSTILLAGAKKVKQLEKEIILLKIEKLRAMKQYKECHLSQIPDTANIYYSMKLELEAIDEEISNLIRILENY